MSAHHQFYPPQLRVGGAAGFQACARRPHPALIVLAALLPLTAQDTPPDLRLTVTDGDATTYAPGAHATRGVTIEVADPGGKPVSGATVTFRLPASGASGAFTDGSRSQSVATGGDGKASVWGLQWNHVPGEVQIRITASKGEARGIAVAYANLSNAAPHQRASEGSGGSHKLVWILLLAAGGAGGGIAAKGLAGKSTSPATSAAAASIPHIGTPAITIGAHP